MTTDYEGLIERLGDDAPDVNAAGFPEIAADIDEAIVALRTLSDENERMRCLLKVAVCPACDGSGAIPHGPYPDGSWEAEQCQWCDERSQYARDQRRK